MGFEKKVKPLNIWSSHFGLTPGSDIMFVNEKISDITGPVFVKINSERQGVQAKAQLTLSTTHSEKVISGHSVLGLPNVKNELEQ